MTDDPLGRPDAERPDADLWEEFVSRVSACLLCPLDHCCRDIDVLFGLAEKLSTADPRIEALLTLEPAYLMFYPTVRFNSLVEYVCRHSTFLLFRDAGYPLLPHFWWFATRSRPEETLANMRLLYDHGVPLPANFRGCLEMVSLPGLCFLIDEVGMSAAVPPGQADALWHIAVSFAERGGLKAAEYLAVLKKLLSSGYVPHMYYVPSSSDVCALLGSFGVPVGWTD